MIPCILASYSVERKLTFANQWSAVCLFIRKRGSAHLPNVARMRRKNRFACTILRGMEEGEVVWFSQKNEARVECQGCPWSDRSIMITVLVQRHSIEMEQVLKQVSHWVYKEKSCVTVQRIVQTFELPWSEALSVLKDIPVEGRRYFVIRYVSGVNDGTTNDSSNGEWNGRDVVDDFLSWLT